MSRRGADRHHQGGRVGRARDAGDVQGAAALRDPRSRRLRHAGHGRGLQPGSRDRRWPRTASRSTARPDVRGPACSRSRSVTATATSARGRSRMPAPARSPAAGWRRQIVAERLRRHGCAVEDVRCDLIGVDSPARSSASRGRTRAVRSTARAWPRAPIRSRPPRRIGQEVEALYTNGPAGGGGAVAATREVLSVVTTFVPRELVPVQHAMSRWLA